jgi:uncharacterized repeat protein (TIGR03803 family)
MGIPGRRTELRGLVDYWVVGYYGPLVSDQAGNLYGTSYAGGAQGNGTVYQLTPSNGGWIESILHSFTGGSDGANPDALLASGQ